MELYTMVFYNVQPVKYIDGNVNPNNTGYYPWTKLYVDITGP